MSLGEAHSESVEAAAIGVGEVATRRHSVDSSKSM